MSEPTLWHYTCAHGHDRIRGWLHPNPKTLLPVVWLTDLDQPIADALGLTRHHITCDRTAYRYRALDTTDCIRWIDARRDAPRAWRDALETAPGAMPMHWWISPSPVPTAYDPIRP